MADAKTRYEAIIDKLRENDHKLTPQRMAIAKIPAHGEGHPNVETIYNLVRDDFPTISQATVHRNILLFQSPGDWNFPFMVPARPGWGV